MIEAGITYELVVLGFDSSFVSRVETGDTVAVQAPMPLICKSRVHHRPRLPLSARLKT